MSYPRLSSSIHSQPLESSFLTVVDTFPFLTHRAPDPHSDYSPFYLLFLRLPPSFSSLNSSISCFPSVTIKPVWFGDSITLQNLFLLVCWEVLLSMFSLFYFLERKDQPYRSFKTELSKRPPLPSQVSDFGRARFFGLK